MRNAEIQKQKEERKRKKKEEEEKLNQQNKVVREQIKENIMLTKEQQLNEKKAKFSTIKNETKVYFSSIII